MLFGPEMSLLKAVNNRGLKAQQMGLLGPVSPHEETTWTEKQL
jgi:hypothetical protein